MCGWDRDSLIASQRTGPDIKVIVSLLGQNAEHLSELCTTAEKSRESITDMSNCREQVSDKPDASTAPQLPAN